MEDSGYFVHIYRRNHNTSSTEVLNDEISRQYYFPPATARENKESPLFTTFHRANHSIFGDDTIADVRKKIVMAIREDQYLADVIEEELFLCMMVACPGCIPLAYENQGTSTMTIEKLDMYFPSLVSSLFTDPTGTWQKQTTISKEELQAKLEEKEMTVAVHEPLGVTITYNNVVFPNVAFHPMSSVPIGFLQNNGFAIRHNKDDEFMVGKPGNNIYVCLARDVWSSPKYSLDEKKWLLQHFFPRFPIVTGGEGAENQMEKQESVIRVSSSLVRKREVNPKAASKPSRPSSSFTTKRDLHKEYISRLHIEINPLWNRLLEQAGETVHLDTKAIFKQVHASPMFPLIRGPTDDLFRLYFEKKNDKGERIPLLPSSVITHFMEKQSHRPPPPQLSFLVNMDLIREKGVTSPRPEAERQPWVTSTHDINQCIVYLTHYRTVQLEIQWKRPQPLASVQDTLEYVRRVVLEEPGFQKMLRSTGILDWSNMFDDWQTDSRVHVVDMNYIWRIKPQPQKQSFSSLQALWSRCPAVRNILDQPEPNKFVFRRVQNYVSMTTLQRYVVDAVNASIQHRIHVDKSLIQRKKTGPSSSRSGIDETIDNYVSYVASTESFVQTGFPLKVVTRSSSSSSATIEIHVEHIQGTSRYVHLINSFLYGLYELLSTHCKSSERSREATFGTSKSKPKSRENENDYSVNPFATLVVSEDLRHSKFGFLLNPVDEEEEEEEEEEQNGGGKEKETYKIGVISPRKVELMSSAKDDVFLSHFFNYQHGNKQKDSLEKENLPHIMTSLVSPLQPFVSKKSSLSFLDAVAFFHTFLHSSQSDPQPVELSAFKTILLDAIDLDVFVAAQNGRLLRVFAFPRDHYDDLDTDELFAPHKSSRFYQALDLKGGGSPYQKQYLVETILAYRHFQTYLRDTQSDEITHEYLWDVISLPIETLFPHGVNLVMLQIDATNQRVEMISPRAMHTSAPYDKEKEYIFMWKKGNEYIPLIHKGGQISFPIRQLQGLLLTAIYKIMHMKSNPPSLGQSPAPLQTILDHLTSSSFDWIVDYSSHVVGVFVTIKRNAPKKEGEEDEKAWIPCAPQGYPFGDNPPHPIKYVDDKSLWQTYNATLSSLHYWQNHISACRPTHKVVDHGIIVGILTASHQFVPTQPYMNLESDELKKYYHVSPLEIDKALALHREDEEEKEKEKENGHEEYQHIGPMHLETEFYLAFRQKMKQLLWQADGMSTMKSIHRLVHSEEEKEDGKKPNLLKKRAYIQRLLRQIGDRRQSIQFVDFNESVLRHFYETRHDQLSCLTAEDAQDNHPFCVMGIETAQLLIPKQNLMDTKVSNDDLYYRRLAEELLRNVRVQEFVFRHQAPLLSAHSQNDYAVHSREMLLTNASWKLKLQQQQPPDDDDDMEHKVTFDIPVFDTNPPPPPAPPSSDEKEVIPPPPPPAPPSSDEEEVIPAPPLNNVQTTGGAPLQNIFDETERYGRTRGKYNLRPRLHQPKSSSVTVKQRPLQPYEMRQLSNKKYNFTRKYNRVDRVEAQLPLVSPRLEEERQPVVSPRSEGERQPVVSPRSEGERQPVVSPRSEGERQPVVENPIELPMSPESNSPPPLSPATNEYPPLNNEEMNDVFSPSPPSTSHLPASPLSDEVERQSVPKVASPFQGESLSKPLGDQRTTSPLRSEDLSSPRPEGERQPVANDEVPTIAITEDCIDQILPKIRGNKGTGWISYFATDIKREMREIKLHNTNECKWKMLQNLYRSKHNTNHADIQQALIAAYEDWGRSQNAQTWFFLYKSLQKQGKSAMMSRICHEEKKYIRRAIKRQQRPDMILLPTEKPSFQLFAELIRQPQYHITDTDLWIFCRHYSIPVILFNPSGIKGFTTEDDNQGKGNDVNDNDNNNTNDSSSDIDWGSDAEDDDTQNNQYGGAGEHRGLHSIDWFRLNENSPFLTTEYYHFIRSNMGSIMNSETPYSILSPLTTISESQMPGFLAEINRSFQSNEPNTRSLSQQFQHLHVMIRRRAIMP